MDIDRFLKQAALRVPAVRRYVEKQHALRRETIETTLQMARAEYTVMLRFGFHQPLDYHVVTLPPAFDEPVHVPGEELPLPPVAARMGYPADDQEYLKWGRYDHDQIVARIERHGAVKDGLSILDLGCSSGRVLRHFYAEHQQRGWQLHGVDVQALPIEWMRRNFPPAFTIYTGTTIPTLPFPDHSFDVIYGFSIFTHIKYLWDMWLLELRRALKPGGLLIQTFHAEPAWDYYRSVKDEAWVRTALPPRVTDGGPMDVDFLYHGDMSVSQVFWKRDIAREFWGRYLEVLDLLEPPEFSFQNWIICRRPG